MRRPLEKYVFALLVVMALACAIYFAGTVVVPEPVPDFALRAGEIYRLEVGAAFFVAFYLATMAFFLALDGKGFAEFGTKGLKADEVVGRQDVATLRQQARVDRQTRELLEEVRTEVEEVQATLGLHRQRLERIETRR